MMVYSVQIHPAKGTVRQGAEKIRRKTGRERACGAASVTDSDCITL